MLGICSFFQGVVWHVYFFLWLYNPIQALAASMKFSVSLQLLDLEQSVGLLGRWSARRKASTCTQTQKNAHTTQTLHIHAQSGIRTRGLGVCSSEDSLCLRPLGYRNGRLACIVTTNNKKIKVRGFSPQANYTELATAACRQS
jgi:hypothetical protein